MKITNQKTPDITELLDDRAKQVVPDTGKIVGEKNAFLKACPKCGAEPGKLCVLASGGPYKSIHTARRAG